MHLASNKLDMKKPRDTRPVKKIEQTVRRIYKVIYCKPGDYTERWK